MEFRDFPLDQWALRAAALARCVPAKHYPAMIDVLMKQQEILGPGRMMFWIRFCGSVSWPACGATMPRLA